MAHVNRVVWGEPFGIPEGSDFRLEAVLTRNGAKDSAGVTVDGTYTLQISDSALNGGVNLLTAEAADSKLEIASGMRVAWQITDAQSSGWEAGTYNGDIKLVDSAGSITYWPVSMTVRTATDS